LKQHATVIADDFHLLFDAFCCNHSIRERAGWRRRLWPYARTPSRLGRS
jgi:hypothetical protein